jgi:sRNA-binding protein
MSQTNPIASGVPTVEVIQVPQGELARLHVEYAEIQQLLRQQQLQNQTLQQALAAAQLKQPAASSSPTKHKPGPNFVTRSSNVFNRSGSGNNRDRNTGRFMNNHYGSNNTINNQLPVPKNDNRL